MLILRDVPDTTNERFWDHDGPVSYVVWPADVGPDLVKVRISTFGLSECSGEPFAINTAKTKAALVGYRDLIQRLAAAKHRADDSIVTLDASDLRNANAFVSLDRPSARNGGKASAP
jgi:hypothetical protein